MIEHFPDPCGAGCVARGSVTDTVDGREHDGCPEAQRARFNVGDKVRCYSRVWTIVPDNASLVGHTMTPEMAASRIKDGIEHLPDGHAVYLDEKDQAALRLAKTALASFAALPVGIAAEAQDQINSIIARAKGEAR